MIITKVAVAPSQNIEKTTISTILLKSKATTTDVVQSRRKLKGAEVEAVKTVVITGTVTKIGPRIPKAVDPELAQKKTAGDKKTPQISNHLQGIMRKSLVEVTNGLVGTASVSQKDAIITRIRIVRDVEERVTTETAKKVVRDETSDILASRKISIQEFQP